MLFVPAADNRVRRYQTNDLKHLGDFALSRLGRKRGFRPTANLAASSSPNLDFEDDERNTFTAIPGLE